MKTSSKIILINSILLFWFTSHSFAKTEECTSKGENLKYGSFSIIEEKSCVTLKCNVSGVKNIESALAVCHQVEKDFKLCGWERNKTIKEAVIRSQDTGNFNVSIKRCEI